MFPKKLRISLNFPAGKIMAGLSKFVQKIRSFQLHEWLWRNAIKTLAHSRKLLFISEKKNTQSFF